MKNTKLGGVMAPMGHLRDPSLYTRINNHFLYLTMEPTSIGSPF